MRFTVFFVLLFSFRLSAQNEMALNPWFELGSIPVQLGQIGACDNVSATDFISRSPDYFHRLSTATWQTRVPTNTYGWQEDERGGNAYVGFMAHRTFGPQCTLRIGLDTIITGHSYQVNVTVALANNARFSSDSLVFRVGGYNHAALSVSDTTSWTTISYCTQATEDGNSLLIYAEKEVTEVRPNGGNWAYYYVGHVSVMDEQVMAAGEGNFEKYILINESNILGTPIISAQKGLHIQTFLDRDTERYYYRKIYR